MKVLLDFLPVAIFFVVYKLTGDILTATAVLIPATLLQMLYAWWANRKIEIMQVVTLVLVVLLGGATLVFHDQTFIQWKPTVVNWLFAAAFIVIPLFTKRPLIKQLLSTQLSLPDHVWQRLNQAWIVFFLVMGAINIFVFKLYSLDIWVDFKLFGMMGLTIVFIILQGIYLSRHMQDSETSKPSN
ncbi:septation protein A [Pokkaliibacter plantistimulans]|uniref:Inner membrane-spanning protein YciB n=1 Tax=Proteobacteria bacterium 228 TaxID=2083153 RepID=A0A2S5KJ92_9PROT|nr:septation protein A [Pokkaliibacter plantistimulans]PPC74822.1 septation protein A [Pokkaliibacter plantistimulans]